MKELTISEIKEELLKLGIFPQLRAFEWLAKAIQLCSQDKKLRENPAGQMYDRLAQEYNCDSSVILQAIRRAVKFSWVNRERYQELKNVFEYCYSIDKSPSSLEFITRVSDYLTKEEYIHV